MFSPLHSILLISEGQIQKPSLCQLFRDVRVNLEEVQSTTQCEKLYFYSLGGNRINWSGNGEAKTLFQK